MTELPAHLEAIVADVRTATRTAVDRSRRRKRHARLAAAALVTVALGAGVAAAAGVVDYGALVERVYPDASVTDLSDRQQRVIASIPGGRADVVVTDLGVTAEARTAPAGTSVCDWNESSETLGCTSAAGSGSGGGAAPEIPAGTRVYRIAPGPTAAQAPPERTVLYVPDLRLQLVVEPRS